VAVLEQLKTAKPRASRYGQQNLLYGASISTETDSILVRLAYFSSHLHTIIAENPDASIDWCKR
jgi:hypothetical protein